jgi:hypothetical protein
MIATPTLRRILADFQNLELPPTVAAQIDGARIGAVTTTNSGVLADLVIPTPSPETGPGERSAVLAELVAPHPVGEAMLHLADGRLDCLEIWLYTDDDWQHVAAARLI